MSSVLIEPHYFPSLAYCCAVAPFDHITLEGHEHYVKQSLRNRCFINTSHGVRMLTVPLEKKGRIATKEVRIESGMRWRNNHWRTIQSAYAKSPFFEHYRDDLYQVIYLPTSWLVELDASSLSFCLRNLGLTSRIELSTSYEEVAKPGVLDLRARISDKNPDAVSAFYHVTPYYQVFGNTFVSNLSAIDLLCCEGPNAPAILSSSTPRI